MQQVVYNIDNIEYVILTVFNLFGIDSLTELRAKGYEIFQHVGSDEYIDIQTHSNGYGKVMVKIGKVMNNSLNMKEYVELFAYLYTDAEILTILRKQKIKSLV